MRRFAVTLLNAATVLLSAANCFANDGTIDKRAFSLFSPTPRSAMREMSTDRPDKTESPYTVDAGHIQIESDLIAYTQDRQDGVRETTLDVLPFNLKLGLTNDSDLQIVYGAYSRVQVKGGDADKMEDGSGDLTIRYKLNIWGNDGGKTAFAVMPYVKLPTSTFDVANDAIEGGLILPLAVELRPGISLGLMTEIDILRSEVEGGYQPTFVNSITIGFDITSKLGLYTELFCERSVETAAQTTITMDAGITYALTDDVQLDTGVNVGVTDAADDLNVFAGLSHRF